MNKTLIKSWMLVVLAACAGCATENWHGEDRLVSLQVDKVTLSGFRSRPSGATGATYEFECEIPTDPMLAAFAGRQIAKCYRMASGDTNVTSGIEGVRDAFVGDYSSTDDAGDWQLKVSAVFNCFDGTFASYRVAAFTYFGGVHPDMTYRNSTFDRRKGRELVVADLFDETNIVSVVNLIRRSISSDQRCSDYLREKCSTDVSGAASDFLGECEEGDGPKVTENFLLAEEGIVWTFNAYEIASYSEGTTDVLVPWQDIAPLVRDPSLIPPKSVVGGYDAALEEAEKNGETKQVGNLIFFEKK